MKAMILILIATLITITTLITIKLFSQKYHPPYFGCALEYPIDHHKLEELSNRLELMPQIIEFYVQWPPLNTLNEDFSFTELRGMIHAIDERGALPCLSWEPMTIVEGAKKEISYEDLISGLYDPYIRHMGRVLKDYKHPIIVRFAHEMNLSIYHWGESEGQFDPKAPEIYRNMYKHVFQLFEKELATNVLWAFCPNADSVPEAQWNTIKAYYPGDAYVDILGIDGYNWGLTQPQSEWRTFEEIFALPFAEMKKINQKKPIIIFETASIGSYKDKNAWLNDALNTCSLWGIDALIWFDVDKENDWKLQDLNRIAPRIRTDPSVQQWAQKLKNTR